jgi:TonB family protein
MDIKTDSETLRLKMKISHLFTITPMLLAMYSAAIAKSSGWLGRLYVVEINISVQEQHVDSPKFKTAIIMPSYPVEYLQTSLPGNAVIQFSVYSDGNVKDVTVLNASSEEFGFESSKAVKSWLFFPNKDKNAEERAIVCMQCEFTFNVVDKK